MPEKHDRPTVCLLVTTETTHYSGSTPSIRVEARPVQIMPAGQVRNLSDHAYGPEALVSHLADLVVTALTDKEHYLQTKSASPLVSFYGWRIEYREPYSVDAHRAQTMTKTLRAITKHLGRLEERFGAAVDFATYLGRVADAIAAAGFVYAREKGRGWSHDDNDYRHCDTDAIRFHLSSLVESWAKDKGFATTTES